MCPPPPPICNCFLRACAIILIGKRQLVALLCMPYWCFVTVIVLWLFLMMPWVGLQCVVVVFHCLFNIECSFLFCNHLAVGERESIVVWCHVTVGVLRLFLVVPCFGLYCVIVFFFSWPYSLLKYSYISQVCCFKCYISSMNSTYLNVWHDNSYWSKVFTRDHPGVLFRYLLYLLLYQGCWLRIFIYARKCHFWWIYFCLQWL